MVDVDVSCVEDELDVAAARIAATRLERYVSAVRREAAHCSGTRLVHGPTAVRRTRTNDAGVPGSVGLQRLID